MASESESDLIISKRPKTKLPMEHDIHSSNVKSNSKDYLVLKNSVENKSFHEEVLVEHKKAMKRTRESDEESSITSDDEAMFKKRVRKNSDDELLSHRPKKVVSAAARKRREIAKTLRESKLAALETDSEYDSDEMYSNSEKPSKTLDEDVKSDSDNKSEDNNLRTKQLDSDHENEILNNSVIKAKKLSSKDNIKKLENLSNKTCHKDEESSSAYNSDSQDEILKQSSVLELQDTTKKDDCKNRPDKETNTLQSAKEGLSCDSKKKMCSNSKSNLYDDKDQVIMTANSSNEENQLNSTESTNSSSAQQSPNEVSHLHSDLPSKCSPQVICKAQFKHCVSDTVLRESKVQTETNKIIENKNCADKCGEKKLENLDDIHLSTKETIKKVIKHNSESSSSDNDTLTKTESESDTENAKMKVKDVKQLLEGQNILKSGSDDSSEDEHPHNKSKLTVLENESLEKKQLNNQNSHASDDENSSNNEKRHENNKSTITLESKKPQKIDQLKKSLKILNNSTDSSDSDRPLKKTKSSVCLKEDTDKKEKFKKQISKIQSSSEDGSSEDEQPLKKTKPSVGKNQIISNSEDSDNFVLKKTVELKKSKRGKNDSSKEDISKKEKTVQKIKSVVRQDKSRPPHSNNSVKKTDFLHSNEKLSILKKEKNNSKKNTNKNRKVEKKSVKTHVSDNSKSSDDDKPLRKSESVVRNRTKIDDKIKKSKKLTKNLNSSDEENNSEDEQPPMNTKSSINEIQTASDSEKSDGGVFLMKQKREQKSENKDEQSLSDSDDDMLLKKSNSNLKNSNKINVNQKKKEIKKSKTHKEISDDEHDSIESDKCRVISRKNEGENKKSEQKSATSSKALTNESSGDSDVPLAKPSKSKVKQATEESCIKIHEKTSKFSLKFSDSDASCSENENLKKKRVRKCAAEERSVEKERKKHSVTRKLSEDVSDSNDSDNSTKSLKNSTKHELSDSEGSSDSESNKEEKRNIRSNNSKSSSENDSDSNSRADETRKNKKALSKMDMRINNFKKYIRAAGIRISNYATFWEGCKSDKQRADKLAKFLEVHGMKGRPTLQKCKKLRIKLEKKKEIEELDLNNIIDNNEDTGRYKCRSSRRQSSEIKTPEVEKETAERVAVLKQRFSRIKDLIDSDSDSD